MNANLTNMNSNNNNSLFGQNLNQNNNQIINNN